MALFLALAVARPTSGGREGLRLSIIVVASEERAAKVLATLRGGGDFAAIARRESQDPAAKAGGYLGEVPPSVLRAELQQALDGVEPGEMTGVVRVPTGYAILKVLGEQEAPPSPAAGIAGNVPLTAEAVVREPADTAGLLEVESAFQRIPRRSGWNRDLRMICGQHRNVIPQLTERLRTELARVDLSLPRRMQLRYSQAVIDAYHGRMEQAIVGWEEAYEIVKKAKPGAIPILLEVLGTAHLQKAQMDHDMYRRPGERCLFPPPMDGSYAKLAQTEDVRKAIAYFSKYLDAKPDDVAIEWLLNLSYMLLGQYPGSVPREHLIPPSLFECKEAFPRFEDVAPQAGIDAYQLSGGIVVEDFDGDGDLDVVTSGYDACEGILHFRRERDGTFTEIGASSGLANVPAGANLGQTDYDNDGCLDLLVMRGGWQLPMPLSLLRGDCKGGFRDATRGSGIDDLVFATQTAVFADVDNDGWLDLFVGDEQGPSQLYRNKKDGTFANVSVSAGIDRTAFTKTVAAGDYDNDGYVDFYISNIRGNDNFLYHNNGDGTFLEVGRKAGVAQSWRSFGAWFFDYDNDGWLDIFVASDYASVEETLHTYLGNTRNVGPLKLYRNARDGTFEDVTEAVDLDKVFMPMGANFGDIDSDGYIDIYLGNGQPNYGALVPNVLLRNREGRKFVDVTECSGTGELHKAHGIAFADFENDGTQDLIVEMGGAVPGDAHAVRLFRNPGNENGWLGVRLLGVKSNRAGVGALIKATIEEGGGRKRTIYRTVSTGGSWGATSLRQHIGLGRARRIVELEVWWPASGTRQKLTGVRPNQFIEIREQSAVYRSLEVATTRLPSGARRGREARAR
jgi:hypothetical protein